MIKGIYTTAQAAKVVGIHRVTLQEWIRLGKVRAPRPVLRNARGVRLWTEKDVARLRIEKDRIYRRGRGRKRKQNP